MDILFCPTMGKNVTIGELLDMEERNYQECLSVGMSENDADWYALEHLAEDTGVGEGELALFLWA